MPARVPRSAIPFFLARFTLLLVLAVAASRAAAATDFAFTHPGLLHTREDLARIRTSLTANTEPFASAFAKFRAHPASQLTYPPHPATAEIGRNPSASHREFDAGATAAYQLALMWCLTGDRAFAEKSAAIVDVWSTSLQRVTGADAVLMAGLGPFKLVNAAELLRHTDSGWPAAEAARTEAMLRRAVVPALHDFAPFANGNWDTAAIKTLLAIAVFCDDRDLFERALRYAVAGHGNGRLTHYIVNDTGQCQESGRDMPHTQLGLAHLGDTAEIAWNQGLDLYAHADNRLLAGFEYAARYNLGEPVPFAQHLDRTGKYRHTAISTRGRGALRPVYEQIYHHYVHRAGVSAPWTQRAAEKLRPEGESRPDSDHPGFGTLLFTRSPAAPALAPAAPPAAPVAVITQSTAVGVTLSWIRPARATAYTVTRTSPSNEGDRSETLARDLTSPGFTDTTAAPGQLYSYIVTAANAHGSSPPSGPARITAGLPSPWQATDIGQPRIAGSAQHDGRTFNLEAAGSDIAGASDQFLFVHTPLADDTTLTARFVPQVSSQSSKFGLMLRAALTPHSPHISLLIAPAPSADPERLGWTAQLALRERPEATRTLAVVPLASLVTHGRLTRPCWLRLTARPDAVTAAYSLDGTAWTNVGTVNLASLTDARIGLVACSRLPAQTTTVTFDQVTLSSHSPK